MMDQSFFNRILHLVNTRPKEGRRMIGLVEQLESSAT